VGEGQRGVERRLMPRIRKAEMAAVRQEQAAAELKMVLDATKPRPRRKPAKTIRAEVEEMASSRDWSKAKPRHMVELFIVGHEQVYGLAPGDLTDTGGAAHRARMGAQAAAERMLRQEFGDDARAMVRFLGWVWKREEGRQKWRIENGREGGRLTWQTVIAGRGILTDYRAAKLREK
jgi:hypothetical protein